MTSQKRPDEMVDILRPDFFSRSEPNAAWVHACSAFLALPALRAFWPMSGVDYINPQAQDIAAGGYHLTNNNVALFGYDQLAPYAEFDGTNQYLSRADGGAANWADIRGTETYIPAAQRGLTLGGWVYYDNAASGAERFLTKLGAAPQRAYWIQRTAAGTASFGISVDGTAITAHNSTATMAQGRWHFFIARFTPGIELALFINSEKTTNAVAIPASIADTTANLYIGHSNDGSANYMDGKTSLCFLCAAKLSDTLCRQLFHQTRVMFNV